MHLLSSYQDKTLVSFEFYEDEKKMLDRLYESAKVNRVNDESNKTAVEIKGSGFSIRQVTEKSTDFFMIRQFFHSKKYIYILTAASRDGETKTMRKFLDSLIFKPDTKDPVETKIPAMKTLKTTPVTVLTKNIRPANQDEIVKLPASEPGAAFILAKPRPSYTDAARRNQVQGTIQLRVSFSENGFIPKIEVIKALPQGLLRQAIFAALRIKFLPKENNGKAETIERVIEYSYQIY
jgi:hypothetical protein